MYFLRGMSWIPLIMVPFLEFRSLNIHFPSLRRIKSACVLEIVSSSIRRSTDDDLPIMFSQCVIGSVTPSSTDRYPQTSGVTLVESSDMMDFIRMYTAKITKIHLDAVVMYFAKIGLFSTKVSTDVNKLSMVTTPFTVISISSRSS